MKQFTLADAVAEWKAATGADGHEIGRRLKLLRDAGFLPTLRERATDLNLARLIIGLAVDGNPSEATEAAMRLFDAVCVESTAAHPLFQPGTTLGVALAAGLRLVKRRELAIHRLLVRSAGRELGGGLSLTGEPGTIAEAAFIVDDGEAGLTAYNDDGVPRGYAPVEKTTEINGNVLHDLAELVAERSTVRSRAALAARVASYETEEK